MWLSVTGSTASALAHDPLTVSLCGPDASGLPLAAGNHALKSTPGSNVGFDLDELDTHLGTGWRSHRAAARWPVPCARHPTSGRGAGA